MLNVDPRAGLSLLMCLSAVPDSGGLIAPQGSQLMQSRLGRDRLNTGAPSSAIRLCQWSLVCWRHAVGQTAHFPSVGGLGTGDDHLCLSAAHVDQGSAHQEGVDTRQS